MNDFTIIRRSLVVRLFSTVVTVLMVATAVALLMILLSMKDAGERAFSRGSGNMHMMVSRDASPLVAVLNGVFYARPPRNPIPWEKYTQIAGMRPWAYAVPVVQGDSYRGYPVLGTLSSFFTQFKPEADEPWRLMDGRAFEAPFEAVLGATVARETGLQLGDEILMTHGAGTEGAEEEEHDEHGHSHVHRDFPCTVVGILRATGSPHDRAVITDLETAWIVHAHDRRFREDPHVGLTTAEDLTDADRLLTGIYLRVPTREGARMSGAQQQAFDMLRRDTSITVADPRQEIGNLFTIVSNIDDLLFAMAIVVMISSGIAITLALYNSMEQRRRQIAVFRVLGCSRGRIFGLVMTESTIIALLGAAIGAVLAFGGARVVAVVMKSRLGLVIEPMLPTESIAIVLIGTVVLAAAAGVIPSIMAYRTTVAEHLRPIG
jgi:putative ABC transport system permease protein